MNQPPILSIIIPTYNRKNMLKRAINSVLSQDYPYIEVIVSDNASTDGTDILMQEYSDDSRVVYIRNSENIGPVKNGQQAYQKATGKYFMILCDDDYMGDSTIFSKAVIVMEENPNIALVRGVCEIHDELTNSITINSTKSIPLIKGIDFFQNYEQEGYPHIDGFFGIVRKEYLDDSQILMWDTFGHDRWLWRVLPLYGDVYFINSVIFGVYNHHEQGQDSNNTYLDKLYQIPETIEKITKLAYEKFPDYTFRDSSIESAYIIKYWLINYKKQHGTKKLIPMFLKHELRQQHPKTYWYLIRIIFQKIINKGTSFVGKVLFRL
ncbi:MAG: glycosyltransferase family 2 protein [Brevinemataceae bacterium]